MDLLNYLRHRPPADVKFKRRCLQPDLPSGRTWRFPDGFLFGAATASHQVEGQNPDSDWWRFERLPGKVRAFAEFPEFAQTRKSDHWHQFPEDIRRMKEELGLRAYRFSIDWSRVEPRPGEFDAAALARYADLCGQMRALGIRPLVTLFHWTSPDWIWDHTREEQTGWYDPQIVDRYLRFVERVAQALAPHVDLFVTFNEPNIFLYGGFSEGILAPGHRRSDRELLPVLRNLLQAHAGAYAIIKRAIPHAEVGIAHQFCPFEPASNFSPLEWFIAGRCEQTFTWLFPDAIRDGGFTMVTRDLDVIHEEIPGLKGTADFMGVNYYERMLVRVPGGWNVRKTEFVHDHHDSKETWPREINSAGFLDILQRVTKRYGLPIHVTENGRAHPDDRERTAFLREHLRVLAHAVNELKLPVRGYFWWSLLDNQEWANGFVPKLGLYEVDYSNGARRLRDTGRVYAEIIRRGEVSAA